MSYILKKNQILWFNANVKVKVRIKIIESKHVQNVKTNEWVTVANKDNMGVIAMWCWKDNQSKHNSYPIKRRAHASLIPRQDIRTWKLNLKLGSYLGMAIWQWLIKDRIAWFLVAK